ENLTFPLCISETFLYIVCSPLYTDVYDYLDININGQIFPLIFSKIAAIRLAESLCFLKTYGKSPKWFSPIFVI
ncbi:MAG: hypothetical protein K2P28_01430, partial [Lachnospiraceae bacterium]|nr:hypothetical protein [Lachnospiraceae bacterium]